MGILTEIGGKLSVPYVYLVGVIGVLGLLIRLVSNKFWKKISDREYKNLKKWEKILIITYTTLNVCVFGPALEETIFRLPLVMVFDKVTSFSWIAIIVVSLIFGALHLRENTFGKKWGNAVGNGFKKALIGEEGTKGRDGKTGLGTQIGTITVTSGIAVLEGYYAIKTQGLVIPFLIHATMNFLGMWGVLSLIIIVVSLLVHFISWIEQLKLIKRCDRP